MNEIHTLFVVCFVAVLAPLLARLPPLARTPVVVLELGLGILIGPSGAGWVTSQGAIEFLGEFGLIFLFFQAGFEFNPGKIGIAPLRLGALAWLVSLGLSSVFMGLLYILELVHAPLLVALVLPTTSFGILIPILRHTDDLESDFGRYVLGAAAIGELVPVILIAVALSHEHNIRHLHQILLSIVFLATAIEALFFARSLRSERLSRMIVRWMGDSSVLPVRISILILLGFLSLANELGMEVVLGAYAAGMMIAMLTKVEILQYRLTSIGSGFLIPLFFITSGVEFDLPTLVTSPASLARLVLFCGGFLFIRFVPVFLYKHVLPQRDLLPLALFSATTLPLVVAMTYLGVRTGDMLPENASALVGAAIITVVVFPPLANLLRSKSKETRSDASAAGAARRVAGLASAQFTRFIVFIAQKIWGNR
ncbi:MAG TPA: cation:proton antiporter [Methylocella sp.]|jgi:Kef-type K+ transport system membrane component KefB